MLSTRHAVPARLLPYATAIVPSRQTVGPWLHIAPDPEASLLIARWGISFQVERRAKPTLAMEMDTGAGRLVSAQTETQLVSGVEVVASRWIGNRWSGRTCRTRT
jgi:hypothetical protein